MGYWKKTVYLMDAENSLAVTESFADFKNFKHIYLLSLGGELDETQAAALVKEDFSWLPFKTPTNYKEVSACITTLDGVIW
jgi:hypothetical protein